MLIGEFGLALCRTNLNDLLDRVADLLGGVLLGDLTAFGVDLDGVLDLALLAFLDNLGLAWLQVRVDADLCLERSLLSPLDLGGGRLTLRADLDDLLDRLGYTLGFGLRVRDLRVLDGQGRSDLVLTQLAFLDSFLLSGFQVLVEDDLGLERHVLFVRGGVSAFSLGTHTDDLLDRLLGALSGHGRLAIRLAVLDLLRRGHNLDTGLTLLINLLFAFLEGVVEDDLGLERNRLLHLGHHSGVLSSRAVLDDLVNRSLRLLLLRGHRRLVTLSSEVSREGLLARHALLDDLDLTRLEFRVRTSLNLERNLRSPGHLLGSLRRLSTNLDHLINRLLGDLLFDGGFTIRLGVRHLLGHSDGLLPRLTLGDNLGGASRQVRIKLDLHTKRNLRLNSLRDLTSRLGADADLGVPRGLRLLSGHRRLAVRLAVLDLLSRGHNFGPELALLVDNLLTLGEGVVEDDLGLERNRLLGLGHQLARSNARAVLDDPLDRLLGGFFLSNLRFGALGRELSSVGLLAVLTFLNNPGFTRLQFRVLANLSRVRDRNRPRHILGSLGRLCADDNYLVYRILGPLPAAVLVLLFRARLALGLDLVLAGGDGVVVLVFDLERHLAGRDVNNVHHSVSGIRGAVLVGHSNRNLDLVARLRIRRCGCGHLTVVVNGGLPTCREITQLVRVFLGDIDVVRFVELHRQRGGLARVHRLHWVEGLRFPVVRQLHHGGDRNHRSRPIRGLDGYGDSLLVARLGICRRGGGDDTGVRVDLVLPAVNFLLGDRLVVLVLTERELRTLRCVLDVVLHGLVRAGGLHVVHRSDVALQDDDGALDLLRLVSIVVVGEHRNIEDVALRGSLRNRRGDFASVLVNLDGPRAAVIRVGVLGLTVLEGVALRGFVGRVAAQAALRKLGCQADPRVRLICHRVVGRDLDVNDRLELGLDLVGGPVRVGRLHLRGDDGARCDGVVRLRGDLAGRIDGDGPAIRHGGLVDLELSRGNRLVALHDGLGAHLRGDVLIQLALGQTRAHQVGDLGVVRVDNHEEFQLVRRAVGVLHRNHRSRESARAWVLRSGDGDVVVLVHLHGPALEDVLLVQGGLGLVAVLTLLLRQFFDQVRSLGEGDLLRLGGKRAGSTIDAGDDRRVGLVILRGVVLRVVQGERLRVDDVWLLVAVKRIGAFRRETIATVFVLDCSFELVHGTWQCKH